MILMLLTCALALKYELNRVPRLAAATNTTGFAGRIPLYESNAYNFVYLMNVSVGTPP